MSTIWETHAYYKGDTGRRYSGLSRGIAHAMGCIAYPTAVANAMDARRRAAGLDLSASIWPQIRDLPWHRKLELDTYSMARELYIARKRKEYRDMEDDVDENEGER